MYKTVAALTYIPLRALLQNYLKTDAHIIQVFFSLTKTAVDKSFHSLFRKKHYYITYLKFGPNYHSNVPRN